MPVIVVGCRLDLRDDQQVSLDLVMSPIMQKFREIETCIECSAMRQIQVFLDISLLDMHFWTLNVSYRSLPACECFAGELNLYIYCNILYI